MNGKKGIKELIKNYKRTCILIPILFISVILLGCTCGGKSGLGSGKDKYNVAGTYKLKWSIMNMYKDDYEDWRNTGDGLERHKTFVLDNKGSGTFQDSGESKGTKLTYKIDSDGKTINIKVESLLFEKEFHGTVSNGELNLFDGPESDDFTVEYMFIRED